MAISRRLAWVLLCTSFGTSNAVCAGKTHPDKTEWIVYNGGLGFVVDVNTSVCGFQDTPVYLTSLEGDSHWISRGSSEVYNPKATTFRTLISSSLSLAQIRDHNWHMHWLASNPTIPRQNGDVCSGRTVPGSTGWLAYDSSKIYVDVDTSACGFKGAPVYVTSLAGQTDHWKTRGSSEVYHPTATGFRIHLNEPDRMLTPALANSYAWHVNWLADGLEGTRPAGDVCSGRTSPGSTRWVVYLSTGIYVDVDTSACGFQATPVYVTSLVGQDRHQFTTGGSEVYIATATGFRVYVYDKDTITPAAANSYEWHINWVASSASTPVTTMASTTTTITTTSTSTAADACADTRGATASTQDMCTCGGSVCKEAELCLASENRCEACSASYELTSLGCQCPPDHASEEGGPCLEVLTKALERVADPTISTSKASNGYTYLLNLQLGPLPSSFFEALNVTYAIDIAPSLEALDFQSNCTGEWTVGPVDATIKLTYGAFEGPCTLTAVQDGGKFIRSGVVGIYIISTDANSGMEHVEWRWTFAVSLVFDASVVGMLTVRVAGDSHLGNRTFVDIGGFSSFLALYQSEEFRNELPRPYALTVGDSVYVQQRLDQPSPDLWLEVAVVYLSSSQEAGDSSAVVRNVTDQIRRYTAGEGEARFAFTAVRCKLCVLHVISLVKLSGRRLGAESSERLLSESSDPRYALQSVYIGSVEEKGFTDCSKLGARASIVASLVQVAAMLSWF